MLATLLVLACAASMVHARWTIVEPAALRYGLVAAGTVAALGIAWGLPFVRGTRPAPVTGSADALPSASSRPDAG